MPKFKTLVLLIFIFSQASAMAGIVKGLILNSEGEPLPYASININDKGNGTFSNEKGAFIINLEPGVHTVTFRYLGYRAITKEITVATEVVNLEIVLQPEVVQLKEVVVGNTEDPARTIMRKTIAMSPIHFMQFNQYSYKAYTKGNLKVTDVPFLLKKEMEKQFMKIGQLYVFESVVKFNFQQPNRLSQKTIAQKDNLPPNLKNTFATNLGSFGFNNPKNSFSPITKKGARNYRYEYLGYFEEDNQVINKIRVIPKTRNAGLFEGTLNIVDKTWYVHSYNYKSKKDGQVLSSKVIYRLIDNVWIPSNFENEVKLNIIGIEASIKAIASVRDLSFEINPKYVKSVPEVFDEKIFDAPPINAPKAVSLKDFKQLKKDLIKETKEEYKASKDSEFRSVATYTKDSLANRRDSLFWQAERLVPLTDYEIKGFKKADSINFVNRDKINEKLKEDSTKAATRNKFKIIHLISGSTYKYGTELDSLSKIKPYTFQIGNIAQNLRFNAVEGLGLGPGSLSFQKNNSYESYLSITTNAYYALARQEAFGDIAVEKGSKSYKLKAKAGSEIVQVNQQNPITTFINASFALLGNDHRAKFFQRKYLSLNLHLRPYEKLQWNNKLSWARRNAVQNALTMSPLYEQNDENTFQNNTIANQPGLPFPSHSIMIWNSKLSFHPFLSKSLINGKLRMRGMQKAKVVLENTTGFGSSGFGKLDLSGKYNFKASFMDWESRASTGFFYKKPSYFIDYQHFNGNELFVNSHSDFRNLAYYAFSTNRSYLQTFNTITPQKFLLSQLSFFRQKSLKEYVFHNFLATPIIAHNEAGYGWEFLQGALNLELVRSWNKFSSPTFSFRIWSTVRP